MTKWGCFLCVWVLGAPFVTALQQNDDVHSRLFSFANPKTGLTREPTPFLRNQHVGLAKVDVYNSFLSPLVTSLVGVVLVSQDAKFLGKGVDRINLNTFQYDFALGGVPTVVTYLSGGVRKTSLYSPAFLGKLTTPNHKLWLGFNVDVSGVLQTIQSNVNNPIFLFADVTAGVSVMDRLAFTVFKRPLYLNVLGNVNVFGLTFFRPFFVSFAPGTLAGPVPGYSFVQPYYAYNYQMARLNISLDYPLARRNKPKPTVYLQCGCAVFFLNSKVYNNAFVNRTVALSVGLVKRFLQ